MPSYPLSLPATPGIRSVAWTMVNVDAISVSPFTLTAQVQTYAGARWEAVVTMPPMRRDKAAAWQGFFGQLNGRYGTFLLGDPVATSPRGLGTGTPVVDGAQTSQASTLNTTGWTAGRTGILLAGDYIQLGTGSASRLHMVTADANSDGSGDAALSIWPPLRADVTDTAAIVVSAAKGVFRLSSSVRQFSYDVDAVYSLSFAAEEAL